MTTKQKAGRKPQGLFLSFPYSVSHDEIKEYYHLTMLEAAEALQVPYYALWQAAKRADNRAMFVPDKRGRKVGGKNAH